MTGPLDINDTFRHIVEKQPSAKEEFSQFLYRPDFNHNYAGIKQVRGHVAQFQG
jgi:hypothetical protein